MQYEVLYANDNGTVKVRMTIDGHSLDQDFLCSDLDTCVKQGMAIFKSELDHNISLAIDDSLIGTTVSVDTLPELPPEDFKPEQPPEA